MTDTTAPTGAIEAKTDRELLELAAKAAGYAVEIKDGKACAYGEWLPSTNEPDAGIYWNPLLHNGDALMLAVKLALFVHQVPPGGGDDAFSNAGRVIGDSDDAKLHEAYEFHNGDPYAATRRAIVRAAAAIGRSL